MISTPCIKLCVVEHGLCIGCGRTLDEIASWGSMAEPQRRAVMEGLAARLAALNSEDQADAKAQTQKNKEDPERDLELPLRP